MITEGTIYTGATNHCGELVIRADERRFYRNRSARRNRRRLNRRW